MSPNKAVAICLSLLLLSMMACVGDLGLLFSDSSMLATETPKAAISATSTVTTNPSPTLAPTIVTTPAFEAAALKLVVGSSYEVTVGFLNVRSCGSVDCEPISFLENGDIFYVITCEENSPWCFVQSEDTSGWINSSFTTRDE